jgi:hypothetical protein
VGALLRQPDLIEQHHHHSTEAVRSLYWTVFVLTQDGPCTEKSRFRTEPGRTLRGRWGLCSASPTSSSSTTTTVFSASRLYRRAASNACSMPGSETHKNFKHIFEIFKSNHPKSPITVSLYNNRVLRIALVPPRRLECLLDA